MTPHSSCTSGTPTVQTLKKITADKKQKYKVPSLKLVKKALSAKTEKQLYAKQQLQVKLSESKLIYIFSQG